MKKLLLFVVDACSSRVLLTAMENGQLPNLQALADHGEFNPNSIAIFPSITTAATTSIVTGQYPAQHGIFGANWYDVEQRQVNYYSDDFWVIKRLGIGQFFQDMLVHLNQQQLRSETLFQTVERAGLQAACLNYLIFHGDVAHQATIPMPLNLIPGVSHLQTVYGPSLLYLGEFVTTPLPSTGQPLTTLGGVGNGFGFDDHNTAVQLLELAELRALPDFTLAYFFDNDIRSHEVGPEAAVGALEQFDTLLGNFFAQYGGIAATLESLCIILTGDHAQSDVLFGAEAAINLNELLDDFSIAKVGMPATAQDDMLICINFRAAQIYLLEPTLEKATSIIDQLLTDSRLDQIIWSSASLQGVEPGYHVRTNWGHLHFWVGDDGPNHALDYYGNHWSWQGELSVIDGQLNDEGVLFFPTYPNAFERIAGTLADAMGGHLWLTPHPGYELALPSTTVHTAGGSHGSLHLFDSVSPLFLAGAPPHVHLPPHPRTVDVAPLCRAVLGLK